MNQLKTFKFTLIELLVVIAIIGILVSMLLPVLSKVRNTSRTAVSKNNLKQIHMAAILYADNNDGILCYASENPPNNYDWPRLMYENLTGIEFDSKPAPANEQMAESSYEDLMFCPVLRAIRGPAQHHGVGRTDYSMNRYFNNLTPTRLSDLAGMGKIEPFIMPGNAMPETQANSRMLFSTYISTKDSGYANYDYNGNSMGLYIDGSITSISVAYGSYINVWVNNLSDFE